MALDDATVSRTADASIDAAAGVDRRIYGYTRLKFFEIRFWEFFALVLLVLAVVFSVFPRHRMLVAFYLERGMVAEALTVVSDMTAENPDDASLQMLLAEVHQRNDNPDSAIAALERSVAIDPAQTVAWHRLVRLYEWTRRPDRAMGALEQLTAADPGDYAALRRLREYYQYYGRPETELTTVVRLVNLEKRLPFSATLAAGSDHTRQLELARDPVLAVSTRTMRKIQSMRLRGNRDPFLAELFRQLYAIRENYLRKFPVSDAPGRPITDQSVMRFLEAFVRTDTIALGKDFAQYLDGRWGQGGKARLLLVQILRWYRLDDAAVGLLAELSRQHPDEISFLMQMAAIARERKEIDSAITAYVEIVRLRPHVPEHARVLADLYLEIGDPANAYAHLKRLVETTDGDGTLAERMIAVARSTGRSDLLQEAARVAKRFRPESATVQLAAGRALLSVGDGPAAADAYETYLGLRPDDTAAQKQLAELYVWTHRYADAFERYRQLAMEAGGRNGSIGDMMRVARYAASQRIIARAFETAVSLRPDDAQLIGEQAGFLLGAGDEPAAIDAYERYLVLRPDDAAALEQLAQLFLWNNRQVDAYQTFKRLVLSAGGGKHLDRLIEVAGHTGRPDLIREALGFGKRMQRLDAAMRLKLADILSGTGDEQTAIAEYAAHLDRNPADHRARYHLAELYVWTGQPKKAYRQFARLLSAGPDPVQTAERMITVAGYTGDPKLVRDALKRVRQRFPKNGPLQLKVADAYLAIEEQIAAISVYRDYLDRHPDDRAVREKLVRLYLWTDQKPAAVAMLDTIWTGTPGSFPDALAAADAYLAAGRVDRAVVFLELAATYRPDDLSVRRRLLTYYRWLDLTEKATATLAYLFAAGRATDSETLALAQAYLARGKPQEAADVLAACETRDRLAVDCGMVLLEAYAQTGKMADAERIVRRLGAENARNPALLAELGDRAMWIERIGAALDLYLAALAREPDNLAALKGSGQIFAARSDADRAIRQFERYNRLYPNDYTVRFQLGELYYDRSRKADAFRQYRKALALIERLKKD